jgi:hypothetical protein
MIEGMPERRWELSAPESQVLLTGAETDNSWALKPALLELVVRRALRLVSVKHRRFLVFSTVSNILVPDRSLDQSTSRSLRVVMEAYPKPRAYAGGIAGVPVEKLAQEVFTKHRADGGYVQAVVLPSLEQRGLFTHERSLRLGLSDTTRWELTLQGVAALADLRAIMETGRRSIREWVNHDPTRAKAFVEMAGASLLLMGDLIPEVQRLRSWASYGLDKSSSARRELEGLGANAFSLVALGEQFGPGESDGLDAAFHTIAEGVDRAWDDLHRRGGFLVFGGE